MANILAIVQVVLTGLSVLFSVIILGVISNKLRISFGDTTFCAYTANNGRSDEPGACNTGYGIGSIGLVVGLIVTAIAVVELIGVEAVSFLGNKIALFIRGGVAAFMAFVWLVCFGVLVAAYNDNSLAKANLSGSRTPAQAASAFSFFSVCLWIALAVILIVFRALRGTGSADVSAPA